MFDSLLVPLDGSDFAEQALPLALSIARRAGSGLNLVRAHVVYALNERPFVRLPYDTAAEAEWVKQEQLYLDATARWVAAGSRVAVTTALVYGLTVDAILAHAQAGNADLIVMTTHGRGPASRFFLGSVADELIRRAQVPLLLTRPSESAPTLIPEPVLENVLIPLDGSALAEQVLGPALALAQVMEARCTLLRVVEAGPDPAGRTEEAEGYLKHLIGRLGGQSLRIQARVVVAAHPAEAIGKEAQAQGSNLIALATHGRGGARRMLLGSVADKVIRGTPIPVLVYRPTAA